jgi:putative nucleotidyltransferase with HDIG domain
MSSSLRNMELCLLMRQLWQKDELTFLHSYRVTKIALSFASFLRLSPHERKELELGALIHDIGKMKIPASVLTKKGKLLEQEFLEIKKHPQFGVEILQNYHISKHVMNIVLHHHERWDGKGYPYGLKGEEIPEFARILALADSLEAMTGIRPYRSPLNWEEAYEEIEKGKGTQFDPSLTTLFLKWMEQHTIPIHRDSQSILQSIPFIS